MTNSKTNGNIQIALLFVLILLSITSSSAVAENSLDSLKITAPKTIASGAPFDIEVVALKKDGSIDKSFNDQVIIEVESGKTVQLAPGGEKPLTRITGFKSGKAKIQNVLIKDGKAQNTLTLKTDNIKTKIKIRQIPGILSLLPPLVAIILAIITRQVYFSLFCGIWLGALFIFDYNPLRAIMGTLDTILIKAMANDGFVQVVFFSTFLGSMIALINKSGGSKGLVNKIRKWAKNPRSGQIATWIMGLLIFFDGYANALIVGNSMRPLTDRLKISREKLSFIVDSTSAPVTSLAFISSWIGFELLLIGESFKNAGVTLKPYAVFIQSTPYRFYPILMLFFVFMIAYSMKDFGPMLKAEIRARTKGELLAPGARPIFSIDNVSQEKKNVPERWYNAGIPIAMVILATLIGLWITGSKKIVQLHGASGLANAGIFEILNHADSFRALTWSTFAGAITALLMVFSQKILNLEEAMETWVDGAKSILPAMIILSLAWALGNVCKDLHTGAYVAQLARGRLPVFLLPLLIFILSSLISFATGTSWGAMSIVMPIAIYVGVSLPPQTMAEAARHSILLACVSGVISGATFGDHCSPISDTTIMSSMASAADHVDHVTTQIPYAFLVGIVAAVFGCIPAGLGLNPWISIMAGLIVLFLFLRFFGKKADSEVKAG